MLTDKRGVQLKAGQIVAFASRWGNSARIDERVIHRVEGSRVYLVSETNPERSGPAVNSDNIIVIKEP
ncbi:hypothetical protein CPT_Moby_268 [Stenotrophomonas phage Moby]|uniref:Uncharacterized protein n=1 Tax=Stenotrophomonas phage Moby TaxID=2601680 RepID=A0A5P8PMS7_9CAUD|nr:hypothetical protein HWC58_gp130 [Stenotrophomonas phage Moby]QFR57993.1 hypothetical protein CPT_Moby_268 [Stenotrophomonas phage Moby]